MGEFKAFAVTGSKLEAAIFQAILYAGMLEKMGKGKVGDVRVLCENRVLIRKRYREADYRRILTLKPQLILARQVRG